MPDFQQLQIIPPILSALKSRGYVTPTPIQEKAIPAIMKGGDVFASAQTGTGKTAAFAIPVLQLLNASQNKDANIRALVIAPTRELAQQIGESFNAYGKGLQLTCIVVFGGVSQRHQEQNLKRKTDILVATPGRLIDLINQRIVKIDHVQHFVLDEADRMLDMGFIDDIKKIISKLPRQKQSLLFAATAPHEIKMLAKTLLHNPVYVEMLGNINALPIEQFVYYINRKDKTKLLCEILDNEMYPHALVFAQTKRGAERLAKDLSKSGIQSLAIHGDKSQSERQRNLAWFKSRKALVLVATDVASRGIDVKELSHVINYDMPQDVDTYIHRIGRTGRAGASGVALSFCEPAEKTLINRINKLNGNKPLGVKEHSFSVSVAEGREHNNQNHKARFMKWNKKRKSSGNNNNKGAFNRYKKVEYAF